jgi:hypothetical protein
MVDENVAKGTTASKTATGFNTETESQNLHAPVYDENGKLIQTSPIFRAISRAYLHKLELNKQRGIVDVDYKARLGFVKPKHPCFVNLNPTQTFARE